MHPRATAARWRHVIEELRQLGPRRALFRIRFEAARRLGITARREPTGATPPGPSQYHADVSAWHRALGPEHWWTQVAARMKDGHAKSALTRLLDDDARAQITQRAVDATRGKIRAFSDRRLDYGAPPDWHLNPVRGARWPSDTHASRALAFSEGGDVKMVWELNRFPHCLDWCRAHALRPDPRWPRAFAEQLMDWERANPWRQGVNWSSGQELAIRLLIWLFTASALGCEGDAFACLQRLVYQHALHIEAHIDYARLAVHNNHLIGEALGLYAVGRVFPRWPESKRWVERGRALLLRDGLAQFHPDGGYCQSSHTYHRLALDYYLWAHRLTDPRDTQLCGAIEATLGRSSRYLLNVMSLSSGALPNWGANDGAQLAPWTSCNYNDFRPLISSIERLVSSRTLFPSGPWDEASLWLFGEADAPRVDKSPLKVGRSASPISGLHTLRQGPDDFAVMRCGAVRDRFGQADQLHVDLWSAGENIAQDGGSYCYNDDLAYHRWFMGTRSHNTVAVDDLDQMLLWRRFKWLYWTQARLVHSGPRRVTGEHDGYLRRCGVRHRRALTQTDTGWQIIDELIPNDRSPHRYQLHWLLGAGAWREASSGSRVELRGPAGIRLTVTARRVDTGEALRPAASLNVGQDGDPPWGWVSRRYGRRTPATSARFVLEGANHARFTSTFHLRPEPCE